EVMLLSNCSLTVTAYKGIFVPNIDCFNEESEHGLTVANTSSILAFALLNQICDMVAIARSLNVTSIVPELDKTSFWNDP
ncbi:hypothetical protein ACJX0J_009025, partial [Zea mays]